MYASVTLAQLQPGNVDELLQFLHDNVVPAAQAQQGFKGLLLLTNDNTNKGIAIGLWETEADMVASETSEGYYTVQLARGAQFFAAPPVREAYQVNIQV
jgi:heme-degrading monooxygenase HmoA